MPQPLPHKPDHFQQQAIDSTARGIRIVAPAGSGKSETLARRIAKRIEKDGVDPKRILVLTFDNAAKKSLTGFFSGLLDRQHMPQIRTFNGHGNQILKSYFPKEIAQPIGNIPTSEVQSIQRRYNGIGRELPILTWDGVRRTLIKAFDALKEQGYFPRREGEYERQIQWLREEYLQLPDDGESASLEEMWSMPSSTSGDGGYSAQLRMIVEQFVAYEIEIRALGMMTRIDQKARAAQGIMTSSPALISLRTEFDEIVVDECQDISRLDAMLVYYTAGDHTLIVLAGDDDQTLYEWRNAHSLYLRHPEIVFKEVEFETIHLNLNYRSPQAILEPAVKLISHNVERIEKSPSSAHDIGELVVYPAPTPGDAKKYLVDRIRAELDRGRDPLDIAVLCHARDDRDQKIPVENLLRQARIPVVEVDRNEQPKPGQLGVWVRSFQKAKGRQWPVVFIPEANDRDIPDNDSIRKGEIEAIRRRFYVAMTRASEKLAITYVRGGDSDRIDVTGEGEVIGTNGASRFLFEAGLVYPPPVPEPIIASSIEVEPAQNPSPPSAHVTENDHLAHETVPLRESPPIVATPAKSTAEKPGSAIEPIRKKASLQPWDPRAEETRKMNKARGEWDSKDYDTAVLCAWKPLEAVLKRMVKSPRGAATPEMIDVIDDALTQGIINSNWKDRLHLWRKVRNQAAHDNPARRQFSPAQFKDFSFQLVDEAPSFFVFLSDTHAPRQITLETRDEFVERLQNLVAIIQRGGNSPLTGKPLKALRFNPDSHQFDILSMQLLMVLRDVRFYVPDNYRWCHSPIVSRFCVDTIGYVPTGLQPRTSSQLKLQPGEQLNQLLARFSQMLQEECSDGDTTQFLLERVSDALALENGNFHAGLKLNPRTGT